MTNTKDVVNKGQFTLDKAIFEWLEQKQTRTDSSKTRIAYEEAIRSFREALHRGDIDLLANSTDI